MLSGCRLAVPELAGRDLCGGDLECRPESQKSGQKKSQIARDRSASWKVKTIHVHDMYSPASQNTRTCKARSTHHSGTIRHSPIDKSSAKLAQVFERDGLVVV